MARKATKSTKKTTPTVDALIDAFFPLIESKGWRQTAFSDVAEAAGMDRPAALALVDGKVDLLRAYIRSIDAMVLGEDGGYTDEDTPRDRLFDLLMRRFEAMAPNRAALARLAKDILSDPFAAACFVPGAKRAMGRYLEAAGVEARGPFGGLRADGLLLIWLATNRVWAEDDSEDLARTMAALDKNLARAGKPASWLGALERRAGPLRSCSQRRRRKADNDPDEGVEVASA